MADADDSAGLPTQTPAQAQALALEALRQRGVHQLDPHRFRLAEALSRRAAAEQGAARQMLDEKVAALLQALDDAARRGPVLAVDDVAAATRAGTRRRPASGPLADLLAHLAQHKQAALPGASTTVASADLGSAPPRPSPVDAQTLDFFRRTWSRLSAEQRLAQSRSALPGNAGPLNSQHLVHRALTALRELSPAYFERFMTHVDALLWLERAQEHAARQVGLPPRAKGARKAPKPASTDRTPPLRMNRRP